MATIRQQQQQQQASATRVDARQASFQFVRNVLQVSFSVIFYLRSAFGVEDFGADSFADVPVRVLRPKTPYAQEVNDWLVHGVYDALKRRYVSKVQLSIGAAHDTAAQFYEEYSFSVAYHDDAGGSPSVALDLCRSRSVSLSSDDEAQYNRVTRMLRSMVTFLTPLPELIDDDKRVSMRLFYTDSCPADYEPCSFRAMRHDAADARLFPKPAGALSEYETLDLGSLDTPYHSLALSLTSLVPSELDDDTSVAPARLIEYETDLDDNDENDDADDDDHVEHQHQHQHQQQDAVFAHSATPLSDGFYYAGADDESVPLEVDVDDSVTHTPLAPTATVATTHAAGEIDENDDGGGAPFSPSQQPQLLSQASPRPVLAVLSADDVQLRRKLPALETALSQLKTPAASPTGGSSCRSQSEQHSRKAAKQQQQHKTPERDRETLRSFRDSAIALLAKHRVGDVMTIGRLQQYVVADADLAALLLRRFEKDGLVEKKDGRGFLVTKKAMALQRLK